MYENFEYPTIEDVNSIPKGDMPGDKIEINEGHVEKAQTIFPSLLETIAPKLNDGCSEKIVISVHGGSGVGKSEIGALLAYYFNAMDIGAYVLSGDNYPYRIPQYNDAERLRVYRTSGMTALAKADLLNEESKPIILDLQASDLDADSGLCEANPWLSVYQRAGKKGLRLYLGTPVEINFQEINKIIDGFKQGEDALMLKRMGRTDSELWYDAVDMKNTKILIIEWTHGNNANLHGVDVPILLNSTPEETLTHRKSRNRDGGTDSPFIMTVLKLEQELLTKQAHKAELIVTKAGELISYEAYLRLMDDGSKNYGPMINAYPDSIGDNLRDAIDILGNPKVENAFGSFYILPSVFNTDLDRGFSVIDYGINTQFASTDDFEILTGKGMDLKFDLILNHASVLSKEFQDILKNGKASKYIDFFIDWNKFWQGNGVMNAQGIVQPEAVLMEDMFFRKPGLPVLMARLPDGSDIPFWNTFYQEIKYHTIKLEEIIQVTGLQYTRAKTVTALVNKGIQSGKTPSEIKFGEFEAYKTPVVELLEANRTYLGQMDLNIESPLVWEFYDNTLEKIRDYGGKILRLDAFAYASKAVGEKNFFNKPGTWETLSRIQNLAQKYKLDLLPEIHARYEEHIHDEISEKGYMTYDFFLPGLMIDAFERKTFQVLAGWIQEIIDKDFKMVNMLGCHDGIPLLDLKGLLSEDQIQNLIKVVVDRGGLVKDLHGKKNMYYQVNATYFSALGEDYKKMLLARAIQMFMPGKPQVWYLDLFFGKNNYDAVSLSASGGHKEINRTNLSLDEVGEKLKDENVLEQLALLKLRNTCPAFNPKAKITVQCSEKYSLEICWVYGNDEARLIADLRTFTYGIKIEG